MSINWSSGEVLQQEVSTESRRIDATFEKSG